MKAKRKRAAIVAPSVCTSMSECQPPRRYCRECSHAIFKGAVTLRGVRYRWEHNPWFGPLFRHRRSGECDWEPHERHPVWAAFDRWHDRKFGKASKGARPLGRRG